jgi:hypothetical protein
VDKVKLDDYLHAAKQPTSNEAFHAFIRAWAALSDEEQRRANELWALHREREQLTVERALRAEVTCTPLLTLPPG